MGELRRPDLDGNMIDLGERRAEPTVLLFWSPGCSHCRELLPAMREWDADPNGARMVVVTSGPAGLNREAGLRAPMILDDEGVLKRHVWRAGDTGGGADRRERAGGLRGGAGGDDGAGAGRAALRRRHRGRLIHPQTA